MSGMCIDQLCFYVSCGDVATLNAARRGRKSKQFHVKGNQRTFTTRD